MSKSATPKLKQFARLLLAHELESSKPADAQDSAAFHVCEKLRQPMSKLMGGAGFRALLSRALTLAGKEVSWLRSLKIKGDGSLDGLDELQAKLKSSDMAEGEVLLVTHILELLVTFIGTDLTLRLLREIWPQMKNLKF